MLGLHWKFWVNFQPTWLIYTSSVEEMGNNSTVFVLWKVYERLPPAFEKSKKQ